MHTIYTLGRVLNGGVYSKKLGATVSAGFFFFGMFQASPMPAKPVDIPEQKLIQEITSIVTRLQEHARVLTAIRGIGEYYRVVETRSYIVEDGDTIHTLARDLKRESVWVRPDQIIEWNGLEAPDYYLTPGEKIVIKVPEWQPHIAEASWYGPGFNGKAMANAKIFYESDATVAAHLHLPLGMKIKVTNLKNDRSIIVEVKDRGAFDKYNRGLDLSRAAAQKLGYHGLGLTNVLVEPIQEDSDVVALR